MNRQEKTQLRDLGIKVSHLDGLHIRSCGKCEHDSLHQLHNVHSYLGNGIWIEPFYRCLTCGTDWVLRDVAVELANGRTVLQD